MVPGFDLQGGAALVAARDAFVTPLLSAFGTTLFRVVVAPKAFALMAPELHARVARRLLVWARASVAAALLGGVAWLLVQAAVMADADGVAGAFAAVPSVLGKTMFGHVVALQLALLVVLAAVLSGGGQRVALGVATLIVALQAGHSHAFSMVEGPSLLLACDVVHLLGAGAWLGGLVPLLLVVRMAPPRAECAAARWFSPLGQACLWALVVSAAWQGWVLVASVPGLIGTGYGWMVLVKAALFGVLFGFAWFNRYRFAPALVGGKPEEARRRLVRSIGVQTGFGVAILLAAVVLSGLPPSMHGQALWPFAQRPSLAAIQEDPDFRREVVWAAVALAGGALLVVAALVARRWRVAAVCVAAVVGWFAVPHLDLLLVEAYPTSYFHSPTGFTAASIVSGVAVFGQNCASCHGAAGHGDGAGGRGLAVPPADLTAPHLWDHSDGELFWWVSHGMFSPEGARVMPGFAGVLDDDAVWAVIDFIRAHNAGVGFQAAGTWAHAVAAPEFGMRCGDGPHVLADFRGRFVRLVIGRVPPAASGDVVTVVAEAAAAAGVCVASDETVAAAYAVVAGLAPEAGVGAEFLIDGDGWLRDMRAAGWDDPAALSAEIGRLRAQRVAPAAGGHHPMHMNMDMKM
jgi:putative copper export protein